MDYKPISEKDKLELGDLISKWLDKGYPVSDIIGSLEITQFTLMYVKIEKYSKKNK